MSGKEAYNHLVYHFQHNETSVRLINQVRGSTSPCFICTVSRFNVIINHVIYIENIDCILIIRVS